MLAMFASVCQETYHHGSRSLVSETLQITGLLDMNAQIDLGEFKRPMQ
jgi:hypothetical protein